MRAVALLSLFLLAVGCGEESKDSSPDTGEPETTPVDQDLDGDGYLVSEDCDDEDPAVHPDAEERCDGIDNDCDDTVDEDAVDAATWYADADGDGYGDNEAITTACEQPSGHVEDATDCDDADATVNPGAVDIPDGVDNDCSGEVDEEACDDGVDNDGDGLLDCEDGDCIDAEICGEEGNCDDGVDNDGDGWTDCRDDECWPECEPDGVKARVSGGTMVNRAKRHTHLWSYSPHIGGATFLKESTARLYSVRGTVWRMHTTHHPSYPHSFTYYATSASCQWSVAVATARWSQLWDGDGEFCELSFPLASRSGVWVDPTCQLDASDFLPERIAPSGSQGFIPTYWNDASGCHHSFGTAWYQGSLVGTGYQISSDADDRYRSWSYEVELGTGPSWPVLTTWW